jgi:lipopolysaccharide assembly protein A
MRVICLLFLIVFAGAVGAFAYFNREVVSVRLFDWSVTASLAAVAGVAYLLGMLSGWSIVGILRRSIRTVTEPYRHESARRI